MTLKKRFLEAISSGDLGEIDDFGVLVSLKQFKAYFIDVKSDYINSFLPAAVIETGQYTATHTKYLFRIRKGIYRIHPDAIEEHNNAGCVDDFVLPDFNNHKIEEAMVEYQAYRVN